MGQGGLFGRLFRRKKAGSAARPFDSAAAANSNAATADAQQASETPSAGYAPDPFLKALPPDLEPRLKARQKPRPKTKPHQKPTPQTKPTPAAQDSTSQPVPITRWDKDEALRHVLGRAADVPAVQQVLDLCDARSRQMPPARWREEMAALLVDNAAGVDALRTIVLRETPFDDPWVDHRVPFACAAVEAIGLTEPSDVVPLLVHVAAVNGRPGRGRDYRAVAVAAVETLGRIGGERALPALRQIRAEAQLGAVRRVASQELDRELGKANLSRADVPEWQAETCGLDRHGLRGFALADGFVMMIKLETDGTVDLFSMSPEGKRLAGRPRNMPAHDNERPAAEIAANLQTVVYAERFRLKQLMQDQRTLTYEDWMEFYIGNPVTAQLCRALIWESSIDGGEHWQRFLPRWNAQLDAWTRFSEDHIMREISEEARFRIVDPNRISTAESRTWDAVLRMFKLKQPFIQVVTR